MTCGEGLKEMGLFSLEKSQADIIDVSESIFNLKTDQTLLNSQRIFYPLRYSKLGCIGP